MAETHTITCTFKVSCDARLVDEIVSTIEAMGGTLEDEVEATFDWLGQAKTEKVDVFSREELERADAKSS